MRREGGGGEEGREEEQLPSTRAVVDFLEDQGDSTMKTELKVSPPLPSMLELEKLSGDHRILPPLSPGDSRWPGGTVVLRQH